MISHEFYEFYEQYLQFLSRCRSDRKVSKEDYLFISSVKPQRPSNWLSTWKNRSIQRVQTPPRP